MPRSGSWWCGGRPAIRRCCRRRRWSRCFLVSRPQSTKANRGALLQFDLPVGSVLGGTTRSGGLGCPVRDIAFNCYAVGAFDGAQPGGYSRFAGGDGLAVVSAVGAFGEGFADALDFADVGFSFVGVGGDGE